MSVGCDTSVRRILRASQRFRSTKGASKARRDHINGEIRNMRSLLPISAEDQERLSYLHSMSLICTYVRKTVLLKGVQQRADGASPLYESFLQALPGFIVALTRDGKLVYVSENVPEYLGLSMVDVLQGDTFYDMMDSRDAEAVEVILREQAVSAERSFVCRMHTSKAFRLQYGSCCSMLVRGRFQAGPPDAALFVALCTPTVDRLKDSELLRSSACFQTLHRPDMRLTHAPYSVLFHLGFSAEELIGRSWYDLLHPDDLTLAAGCHRTLTGAEGAVDGEMLVRLLCKDLSWIWLYVCVTVDRARELISCTNHVLSEAEALYLKDKLYGGVSSQRPVLSAPRPREREAVRRSSETSDCSGGTDGDPRSGSLAFSTPPYSPTSSHSSDFLSDGYSGFEQLADGFCPSQAFCDPSCGVPPVCLPDAHLVPIYRPALDVCEAAADCVLHPEDFSVFPLPHEGDLLTPEASPTADGHFLYSETERAEIGTLAHQIRSLASSFDAYSTTRHLQPDSAPCWPPAPEPLLDETVIDSILRDLVSAKEPDCVWSRSAAGAFSACVYEHQR